MIGFGKKLIQETLTCQKTDGYSNEWTNQMCNQS